MTDLPTSARVIVVGGGIVGCSVAYHLGKLGWTDVLLLEQGRLTSGSTWHAAGLVGQLRTSANITQLLGYSVELYDRLEAETGQATGWKRNGGLRLACTADRWTEVRRQATTAHSFGLDMHLLSAREAQELWPPMTVEDVVGAAFLPTDGQANPADITQALAKGARLAGVTLREDVGVTGFELESGPRARGADFGRTDRLREGGLVRRPMDPSAGRTGWRQRAAGVGPAPVPGHRGDSRRDAQPADAARPGPPDLLQGGGRRPGHGRLRAQPQALGRARTAGAVRVPAPGRGLGSFRADHGAGARARAGPADGRRQAADQRPGELHARRQLDHRRGAGDARRLRRRRLQRLRHRLGRRRRDGAGRMGRQG